MPLTCMCVCMQLSLMLTAVHVLAQCVHALDMHVHVNATFSDAHLLVQHLQPCQRAALHLQQRGLHNPHALE